MTASSSLPFDPHLQPSSRNQPQPPHQQQQQQHVHLQSFQRRRPSETHFSTPAHQQLHEIHSASTATCRFTNRSLSSSSIPSYFRPDHLLTLLILTCLTLLLAPSFQSVDASVICPSDPTYNATTAADCITYDSMSTCTPLTSPSCASVGVVDVPLLFNTTSSALNTTNVIAALELATGPSTASRMSVLTAADVNGQVHLQIRMSYGSSPTAFQMAEGIQGAFMNLTHPMRLATEMALLDDRYYPLFNGTATLCGDGTYTLPCPTLCSDGLTYQLDLSHCPQLCHDGSYVSYTSVCPIAYDPSSTCTPSTSPSCLLVGDVEVPFLFNTTSSNLNSAQILQAVALVTGSISRLSVKSLIDTASNQATLRFIISYDSLVTAFDLAQLIQTQFKNTTSTMRTAAAMVLLLDSTYPLFNGTATLCGDHTYTRPCPTLCSDGLTYEVDQTHCPVECNNGSFVAYPNACPILYDVTSSCLPTTVPSCVSVGDVSFSLLFNKSTSALNSTKILQAIALVTTSVSRFAVTAFTDVGTNEAELDVLISYDSTLTAFDIAQLIQTAFKNTTSLMRSSSAMTFLIATNYPVFNGSATLCDDGNYSLPCPTICSDGLTFEVDQTHCPQLCDDGSYVSYTSVCPIAYDPSSTCTPSTSPSCLLVGDVEVPFLFNTTSSNLNGTHILQAVALVTGSISRLSVKSLIDSGSNQATLTFIISYDSVVTAFDLAQLIQTQFKNTTSPMRTATAMFYLIDTDWPLFIGMATRCGDNTFRIPCPTRCSSDGTTYVFDTNLCPTACFDGSWATLPTICPIDWSADSTCLPTQSACVNVASVKVSLYFSNTTNHLNTTAIITAIVLNTGYSSRWSVDSFTDDGSTTTLDLVISYNSVETAFAIAQLLQNVFVNSTTAMRQASAMKYLIATYYPTFTGEATLCGDGTYVLPCPILCPSDGVTYAVDTTHCPIQCGSGSFATPPSVCPIYFNASSTCLTTTTPSCVSVASIDVPLFFSTTTNNLVSSAILSAVALVTGNVGRLSVKLFTDDGSTTSFTITISPDATTTAFTVAQLIQTAFGNSTSLMRSATAMQYLDYNAYPIFVASATLCPDSTYTLPCPIICASDLTTIAVDENHCPLLCTNGTYVQLPNGRCDVVYTNTSACTPTTTNSSVCALYASVDVTVGFHDSIVNLNTAAIMTAMAADLGINVTRLSVTSFNSFNSVSSQVTIRWIGDGVSSNLLLVDKFATAFYNLTSHMRTETAFALVNPLQLPTYDTELASCVTGGYAVTQKSCPDPFYPTDFCFIYCGLGEGYQAIQTYNSTSVSWSESVICTTCSKGYYSGGYTSKCTECPIGTYSSADGSSTCTQCPIGRYASATASTGCASCSLGTYNSLTSSSNCTMCPIGSFANTTGSTVCLSCSAGMISASVGLSTCTACGVGKYAPTTGSGICISCDVGTYTNITGASICTSCARGTYQDSTGKSNCTSCAAGTYINSTAAHSCTSCAVGTATSTVGATSCTTCTKGRYASSVGMSACSRCPAGTIANATGMSFCYNCAAGTISDGTTDAASSNCTTCAVGTYSPADGQSICTQCALGYAATTTGSTQCTMCQPGSYAAAVGSTNCTLCATGYAQSAAGQTNCTACATGSSSTSPGSIACSSCGSGTISYTTTQCQTVNHVRTCLTACSTCAAGTYADSSSNTCINCASGKYSDSGSSSTQCYQCDLGTYSLAGSSTCSACSPGTASSSKGASACTACLPGTFAHLSQMQSCLACPAGRISNPITGYSTFECTACAAGNYTSTTGQSVCSYCGTGTFSSYAGAGTCELCGPGSIAASVGSTGCTECPVGFYSSGYGSSQCTACGIGTYAAVTGAVTCDTCPSGNYTSTTGLSFCSQCSAGQYATGITTVSGPFCSSCPAGTYSAAGSTLSQCYACPAGFNSSAGASVCVACAAGTIAATTGSSVCTTCTDGYYQDRNGTSSCVQCVAGRYSNSSTGHAISGCTSCPSGSFAAAAGSSVCTPCSDGQYQDRTGTSNCNTCNAGRYSNFSTGYSIAGCTICPAGSIAATSGSNNCTSCSDGYYQDRIGTSSCVQCLAGRYSNSSTGYSISGCTSCPAGSFAAAAGSSVCTSCSDGQYQDRTGTSNCNTCVSGRYSNLTTGYAISECTICPAGSIAATSGSNNCTFCSDGYYQDRIGTSSCILCVAGRYSNSTMGYSISGCTVCPSGSIAATPGSNVCTSCSDGYYQDRTGTSSCAACVAGRYSNSSTGYTISGCTTCPAGTFSPTSSSTTCTSCTDGQYQDQSGSSSCTSCPVGTYSNSATGYTTLQCTPCPMGTYAASPGTSLCSPCTDGYFADKIGYYSCIACDVGRFTNSTLGYVTCSPCDVGTFQNNSASSSCDACAPGKYTNVQGSNVCLPCAPGYYTNSSQSTICAACPFGTYSNSTGVSVCTSCVDGFYIDATGSVACLPCAPGSFTNSTTGYHLCQYCAIGSYESHSASTGCSTCLAGTFANVTGSLACDECDVGRYAPSTGSSICEFCQVGRYANRYGVSGCASCEVGTIANTTGLSVCSDCQPGFFTNSSDDSYASRCYQCDMGYYTSFSGSSICTACSTGTYSSTTGISQCTSCEPGRYVDTTGATVCLLCDPGYDQPNVGQTACVACDPGTIAAHNGSVKCTSCDEGSYANTTGLSVCTLCSPGYYQDHYGQTNCTSCPAGKFSNGYGTLECSDCEGGTFSVGLHNTGCQNCSAGSYIAVSGGTSCTLCSPGLISGDNAVACVACPRATYAPGYGNNNCTACADGTYNEVVGASSCLRCVDGYSSAYATSVCKKCPAGRFEDVDLSCVDCALGKFSNESGVTECTPCPVGKYQNIKGQSTCDPCGKGTYTNTTGTISASCTPCEVGSYMADIGYSQCMLCSPGTYAPSTSATKCLECDQGTFAAVDGSGVCTECAAGTHQDLQGKSVCVDCTPGSYSLARSISCKACAPGYFSDANLTSCLECDPGSYSSVYAATNCTLCDVGSYQSAAHQASCLQCPKGFYANMTGLTQCLACDAGMYSSDPGSVNCISCAPGYFSLGTYSIAATATVCTSCAKGTYAPLNGSTSCLDCDPGTHQDTAGSSSCLACAPGTVSTGKAATCDICAAGMYSNVPLTSCLLCDEGSITSLPGKSVCDLCLAGSYAPIKGSTVCTPCDLRTYSSANGSTICSDCDPGTYAGQTGLTACKICNPGSVSQARAATCTICTGGSYSNQTTQTCEGCPVGTQGTDANSCIPCAAGYFGKKDENDKPICVQCPTGTYSNMTGSTICIDCDAGTYSNAVGLSSCVACAAGSIAATRGLSTCTNCLHGTYATLNGSTTCDECDAGTYSNAAGLSTCVTCAAGSIAATRGLSTCTNCLHGSYATLNGSTVCTECDPGTYSDTAGLSSCVTCALGSIAPNRGLSTCATCQPGTYASSPDAGTCTQCPAGFYQKKDHGTSCDPCPVGRYTSSTGQFDCNNCDIGKYTNYPNSTGCLTCPTGAQCNSSGTALIEMGPAAGYWARTNKKGLLDEAELSFYQCPSPSACLGGNTSACAVGYTGPVCALCDDGYFTRSGTCYPCQSVNIGLGVAVAIGAVLALALGLRMAYTHKGVRSITPGGLIKLMVGFVQVMQVVQANYNIPFPPILGEAMVLGRLLLLQIVQITSFDCVRRVTFYNTLVVVAVLPVFIVMLLFGLYFSMPWCTTKKRTEANHFGLKVRPMPAEIKLALEAAELIENAQKPIDLADAIGAETQVTTPVENQEEGKSNQTETDPPPITSSSSLPPPPPETPIIPAPPITIVAPPPSRSPATVISDKNDGTASMTIISTGPTTAMDTKVTSSAPIIIPTECLPFAERTPEQSKELLAHDLKEEQKLIAHRRNFLIKLIFLFLTVVYPGVSIMVFQTFVCRNINGTQYLEADYSLQCYTSEHYQWLFISGVIILLVPIGVPTFLALFLYYRVAKPKAFLNPDCLTRYGHLYTDYHTKYYWWECAELVRKLLLTAVIAFLASGTSIQIIGGLFVSVVFHVLHAMCNPFIDGMYGWLQHGFLAIIWLSLLVGLILKFSQLENNSVTDDGSGNTNHTAGLLVLVLYASILGIAVGIIGLKVKYYLIARKRKNEAFAKATALKAKHDALDKAHGPQAVGHRRLMSMGDSLAYAREQHASLNELELATIMAENGGALDSIKGSVKGDGSVVGSLKIRTSGATDPNRSMVRSMKGGKDHAKNAPSNSAFMISPLVGSAGQVDHTALSIEGRKKSTHDSSSDSSSSSSDSSDDEYKQAAEIDNLTDELRRELSQPHLKKNRHFAIVEEDDDPLADERSISRLMAELNKPDQDDQHHSGSETDDLDHRRRAKPNRDMSISRQMFQLMNGTRESRAPSHDHDGEGEGDLHRPNSRERKFRAHLEDEARKETILQAHIARREAKKARKALKKERKKLEAERAAMAAQAGSPTFQTPAEIIAEEERNAAFQAALATAAPTSYWSSSIGLPVTGLPANRAIPSHTRVATMGVGTRPTRMHGGVRPLSIGAITTSTSRYIQPAPTAAVGDSSGLNNSSSTASLGISPSQPYIPPISIGGTPKGGTSPFSSTPIFAGPTYGNTNNFVRTSANTMHFNPLDPDAARFVFLPPPPKLTPTLSSPNTTTSQPGAASGGQTPTLSDNKSLEYPRSNSIGSAAPLTATISSPTGGTLGSGVEDPSIEVIAITNATIPREPITPPADRRTTSDNVSGSGTALQPAARPNSQQVGPANASFQLPNSPQPSASPRTPQNLEVTLNGEDDGEEDEEDDNNDVDDDEGLEDFLNMNTNGKLNILHKKH